MRRRTDWRDKATVGRDACLSFRPLVVELVLSSCPTLVAAVQAIGWLSVASVGVAFLLGYFGQVETADGVHGGVALRVSLHRVIRT